MRFLLEFPEFSPENTFFGYSSFQLSVLRELSIVPMIQPGMDKASPLVLGLSLMILSNISAVLSSKFVKYFPLVLYTILGLIASPIHFVQTASTFALNSIAKACNYSSTHDLIKDNVDYLTISALHSLETHYSACNALTLLRVLLDVFPTQDLLSLQIMDSFHFLIKMCAEFRESGLTFAIEPFYAYITAVDKVFPTTIPSKSTCHFRELDDSESFLDYYMSLTLAVVTKSDEDTLKEMTPHVQLVHDIVQTCNHFITSHSKTLSLYVMKVCEKGMCVLSHFDDQRLPLVHKVWVSLMFHVNNQNYAFYPAIVSLVTSFSSHSPEFITHRVSKEFLPRLISFLSAPLHIKHGLKLGESNNPTISPRNFSLLLSSLKTLISQLDLRESDQFEIHKLAVKFRKSSDLHIQKAAVDLSSVLVLPISSISTNSSL